MVDAVDAAAPRWPRASLDLGFVPGTDGACAARRAPLGDPTLYELRGTQLCLRRSRGRARAASTRSRLGRARP